MFLAIAGVLFSIFVANVALGAFGETQAFGDIGELLALFCASVCFVVAILRREANEKRNPND